MSKLPTNQEEEKSRTHKLERKEPQAIHSSQDQRGTGSSKYHSNEAFEIEVLIHTCGPELMVRNKYHLTMTTGLLGHTSC